eukprot:Rhum_TRINITY_DN10916_c0_g15::Rhum_TRINITY_DN10916_c0_g15_i1::g.41386::m.41386
MERLHVCKTALVSAAVLCFLGSTGTDSLTLLQDGGNPGVWAGLGGCWIGVWRTSCNIGGGEDGILQHYSTNSAPIGGGSGEVVFAQIFQIAAIVFGAVTALWSVGVMVCARRKVKRLLSWRCCLGVLHLIATVCGCALPLYIRTMGNACSLEPSYYQIVPTKVFRGGFYIAAFGGIFMVASSLCACAECCVGIDELYQTVRQPESREAEEQHLDVDLHTIGSGEEDAEVTSPPEDPFGYASIQEEE